MPADICPCATWRPAKSSSPLVAPDTDAYISAEFAKDSIGGVTVGVIAGSQLVWTRQVLMESSVQPFLALPSHGLAALGVLLLYAIQSEVRFGQRARTHFAGPSDRGSTLIVSASAVVPVIGFVLVMKATTEPMIRRLPDWLWSPNSVPGMPALAWVGVGAGVLGLLVRLWAVLTLKERYTRTLRVDEQHTIERGRPYRLVRHPGYLGSLLCLNGIALATGNACILAASLLATGVAYAYRIRIEDRMLVSVFGEPYELYRGEVKAVVPCLW